MPHKHRQAGTQCAWHQQDTLLSSMAITFQADLVKS